MITIRLYCYEFNFVTFYLCPGIVTDFSSFHRWTAKFTKRSERLVDEPKNSSTLSPNISHNYSENSTKISQISIVTDVASVCSVGKKVSKLPHLSSDRVIRKNKKPENSSAASTIPSNNDSENSTKISQISVVTDVASVVSVGKKVSKLHTYM